MLSETQFRVVLVFGSAVCRQSCAFLWPLMRGRDWSSAKLSLVSNADSAVVVW